MRYFILVMALSVVCLIAGATAGNACEIHVKVKKPEAKSAYLPNGEKISKAQADKLKSTGCKFIASVLSPSELTAIEVHELKKKLEKKLAKPVSNTGTFAF